MQNNYQNSINEALKDLSTTRDISSALRVCNALLEYMGVETRDAEDIELTKLKLPNAERYDRWFEAHPHFRGDRACFELTPNEDLLEAKFYALQKRSKLFIAGSVTFTPNFEDRDYTRTDPSMRVGIDFFLPPEKNSVIVALSNKGSLRLVELSGRLTNTQHEIFAIWHNIARSSDKNALHMTMWESFKLSSLNEKFYEGIANSFTTLTQHLQRDGVEEQLANQFANRLHGRLLFLWFLRKKHIINEEKGYFAIDGSEDTGYYRTKLSTLFFNVLNNEDHKADDPTTPYLNGGLFDQDADGEYWKTHKPTFPTGFFKTLYDHFDSFNFTTDESTPEYEQIAIDPEMLGRIFESFLATLKTETGAQAKKANGAFYTPREIVGYMSRESLRQYLYTALSAGEMLRASIDELLDRPDNEWALAGTNSKRDAVAKEDRERILEALRNIRVLDPAVGSGAFPMGVLHKILSLYERLEPKFDSYETKLSILRNNIYGVDIDPTAIEISRLRAWLSVIVDAEGAKELKPLPNLDFKFVCANTLVGLANSETSLTTDETLKPTLMRIRDEYYATSSKTEKDKLQKEYLKITHKESLFDTEETRQLKSYQPFHLGNSTSFYDPELMHGVEKFDVVIGNPPYVRQEEITNKEILSKVFTDIYDGRADLYTYFIKLGFVLLKPEGVLAYITSNKYLVRGYGKNIRKFLSQEVTLGQLINFGELPVFQASVDSAILIATKSKPSFEKKFSFVQAKAPEHIVNIRNFFTDNHYSQEISSLDENVWVFDDPNKIRVLNKIRSYKKTLGGTFEIFGGIKTGYDKAFVIDKNVREELIKEDARCQILIKPWLKGRDIKRWSTAHHQYIIYIPQNKINIDDYPSIKKHLLKYKDRLSKRATKQKWYELQQPQERFTTLFEGTKIIYSEIAKEMRAFKDESHSYGTMKMFFIPYNPVILAILNSKLFDWYARMTFSSLGDPWNGGRLEFKTMYMSKLPLPELVGSIQNEITALVEDLSRKNSGAGFDDQIDALVYRLYELNGEEIGVIENSQ